MKDYANLLWKLENIYEESHIARSLCIPRLDEFAERAQELNSVSSNNAKNYFIPSLENLQL